MYPNEKVKYIVEIKKREAERFDFAARYNRLGELAASLKDGSIIVDVGTGRAGSANWLAKYATGCHVYTIDRYQGSEFDYDMQGDYVPASLEDNKDRFAEMTNMTFLKGDSPNDFADWQYPIDLLHYDSCYDSLEEFKQSLYFWLDKVRPGGIFCGQVFKSDHWIPHVIMELVEDLHVELQVFEAMYWFYKPVK